MSLLIALGCRDILQEVREQFLAVSVRMPRCQKLCTNDAGLTRSGAGCFHHSCTHTAPVIDKGLRTLDKHDGVTYAPELWHVT